MKIPLMILTAAFGMGFALNQADAGQCTQEIQNYEKLAVKKSDAGMGPTQPTAGGTATSAGDTGATPKAGEVPGTEATTTMNQAVEGKATSPEDVQKQNQGQPTAADSGQPESAEPAAGPDAVNLEQARQLDRSGKEAECMAVMEKLKAKAQ
jgi:hypothetical protein